MEEWNRVRARQYSSLLLHKLLLFLSFSLPAKSTFLIRDSSVLEMYTFHIHISVFFFYHSPCKLRTSSILSCFFAVSDEPWHSAEFSLPEIFFSSFYALSFHFTHTIRKGSRWGKTSENVERRGDGKGDYTSLILESNHTHKHEKRRQISSLRQPTRISLLCLYCSIQSNATLPSTKCLFLNDNFRTDK